MEEIESESEEDSEDETPMDAEDVQMDFEARTAEDCDFNGIKTLLQQVFLKSHVNLSELADTIISQNYVGSIVKQVYDAEAAADDDDDDDDAFDTVFALSTVLNLTERKELECVKQMKTMLTERCKQCSKDKSEKFDKLLNDPSHQLGYLVNERYVNLPPNMAIPMLESLVKEMEKACQKQMKYKFDHLIMVCKTFEMAQAHNRKDLFWSNPEEELFHEVAEMGFSYSVANERDSGVEKWSSEDGMEPFRTVLVIAADKLPGVIEKMKQELTKT